MLTYGDGVGDINIRELLSFHRAHGKAATISMYNFAQYKGVLEVGKDNMINAFREKSNVDGNLVNIGYMVFESRVFDFLDDDNASLEKDALARLADAHQLVGRLHSGFRQCVDTLREKQMLEQLWASGRAPWVIW